jgi:hypothetical protein
MKKRIMFISTGISLIVLGLFMHLIGINLFYQGEAIFEENQSFNLTNSIVIETTNKIIPEINFSNSSVNNSKETSSPSVGGGGGKIDEPPIEKDTQFDETINLSNFTNVTDGLIEYWNFDGNSNCESGINNGTSFGNISYLDGKIGQAVHFDGSSYIEIADRDYFSPSTFGQHMTVSFWMKPDTYDFAGENIDGYIHFLGKREWNSEPSNEWVFRLYNRTAWDDFSRSQRLSFYVFNRAGGFGAGSALNQAAEEENWTFVVGTIDGNFTSLYINGKLVDSDSTTEYNITMSDTTSPLRIGTADKESFFKGAIDELKIYNYSLNELEIETIYSASAI